MSAGMRRREFIAALGGAAVWPLAAWAQQGDRVRRIGVLMPFDENDSESKRRYSAFSQALADLGWTDGALAVYCAVYGQWKRAPGETLRVVVISETAAGTCIRLRQRRDSRRAVPSPTKIPPRVEALTSSLGSPIRFLPPVSDTRPGARTKTPMTFDTGFCLRLCVYPLEASAVSAAARLCLMP
jgi:hypothetical protein